MAIKETYLDRLLTDEEAAGLPNILNLDPDVNVRRGDYRSLSDAYNYYLGGGLDAIAPVPPSEVDTTGVQTLDTSGLNQGTSGENTGITAAGVATPIAPTVEQTAAMEDIGAIPSIVQDPMTGDASIAEAIAAQDRQNALNQTIVQDPMTGDASIAEAIAAQNRMEAGAPIMDQASDEYMTEMVKTPLVQEALGKVKDGISTTGEFISRFGMPIWNAAQGAYGASLAGLFGIPGIALGILSNTGTQVSPEQKAANAAFEQRNNITIGDDGRIASGPLAGLNPAGKSMFGSATYEEQIDKKIANIEKNYEGRMTTGMQQTIDDLNAMRGDTTRRDIVIDAGIAAADEDIGSITADTFGYDTMDKGPDDGGFGDETGKRGGIDTVDDFSDEAWGTDESMAAPTTGDSGSDSFFDAVDKAVTEKPTPRAPDFVTGGGDGGGVGSYSGPGSQGVSGDVQQSGPGRQDADTMSGGSGNGGSGGGGKIVCTMMNDSYGFGSFRNKIWLRQSKNLAPEYQIGYHKIFLPLVKLSKKNIVLKKILEHIAVHRTIDIRQEARGKTHMLGRIYRKILEPICYWVGKNG